MEMSRRSFLKTAGAVSAAATVAGAAVASADEAAGEKLLTAADVQGKWAFEVPPAAITDDQIVDTVEADLIVVGAGTSGLVCANAALDEGLNVCLISASSIPCSRGGSNNAAYSKVMERLGIPRQPVYAIQKEILANQNCVDQRKWYKYYNQSEEAFNYVIDLAEEAGLYVGLEQSNQIKESSLYYQPLGTHTFLDSIESTRAGMSQQLLVEALAKRLVDEGGRLDYRMRGYELVRGGVVNGTEGRVDAIIAQNLDDETYVKYVGTKAIVLATGDFSTDRDMMTKYCADYVGMVPDESYDAEVDYDDISLTTGGVYKGDGQKMGLWIGAAWQKNLTATPMYGPRTAGPAVHRCQNFFGLLVDRNGRRFMDEYEGRSLGPINQSLQAGAVSYAIWDAELVNRFVWYDQSYVHEMRDETIRDPEAIKAGWDAMAERGAYWKADTIEELVELAGLPASTVDEVARYNKFCEEGFDGDFYKDPEFLMPVTTPPFYCQRSSYKGGQLHTVLGGLRTNSEMQVCDADDNPIPGLYNVGAMVGDMYAGMYTFMIAGLNYGCTCITFGYLTGKYVAANE
ncbi:MAG: FAD-binding protein [Coriobacteriales bacterium]|nr:FAD-binding protein [Coriobacteriales bacterium]